MIRSLASNEVDQQCAAALIESDRMYFELGASTAELSVGELAWMRGLTDLAASCVVHRIDFEKRGSMPTDESWIDEIEQALRTRNVVLARIYLDNCPTPVAELLRARDYEYRCEVGYLAPAGHPPPPPGITLQEIRSEADWSLKLALHERATEGPDGYTNDPRPWVEMERRKCATGRMQCFLVRQNDDVVGAVGSIVQDGLSRLKNIVVAPEKRRQGIALATVQLLWQLAEQTYDCRLGVFGVEGGAGSKLYRRAGLYEVAYQYEWSKNL